MIKKYAKEMPAEGKQQLEQLIRGEEIEAQIEKYMVYSDLDQDGSVDRMWNLFLISGYLKCTGQINENLFKLKIPNREVLTIFEKLVREWFEVSAVKSVFQEFIRALKAGEVSHLDSHLGLIAEQTFSNFETGFNQAESFYHAFFLGMLMNLRDKYIVHSNKETVVAVMRLLPTNTVWPPRGQGQPAFLGLPRLVEPLVHERLPIGNGPRD